MATGWQGALDELKAGRGGYYVPDPSSSDDCQSVLNIRGQLIAHRDDVQNRLKDFKKSSSTTPMKEIIAILNSKIALYQAAVERCQNPPQPAATVPGATSIEDVSPTNTVEDNTGMGVTVGNKTQAKMAEADVKSNKKTYIIVGIIALVIITGTIIYVKTRKK